MNCVHECSDDKFFIGRITSVNSVDTSEWCEDLKIEGKVVKVQLDTGVKVNVISIKVLQDFASCYPCEKTQLKLKSYSGHQIPTKGVVTLPGECKGNTFQVHFYVVEMESPLVFLPECTYVRNRTYQSVPREWLKRYMSNTQIYFKA